MASMSMTAVAAARPSLARHQTRRAAAGFTGMRPAGPVRFVLARDPTPPGIPMTESWK